MTAVATGSAAGGEGLSLYIPRTCTQLRSKGEPLGSDGDGQSLSAFEQAPAYVLLGDAGAGKSTEFRRECERLGEAAVMVSARDFVTLGSGLGAGARTLFIDGLDEMRAGTSDARVPLDQIRRRLHQLGSPRFRLACREADWLGNNDRTHLDTVAPGGQVTVLRLDPLTETDAWRWLEARHGDTGADGIVERAQQAGISSMLTNPLTLDLLVRALAMDGPSMPSTRCEVFEAACRHMAQEHNPEHRIGSRRYQVDEILMAAGELCARQLLAGIEGFSLTADAAAGNPTLGAASAFVALETLKPIFADRGSIAEAWLAALRSNLFVADTSPASNAEVVRLTPRHRQVAEFLGGRYLAYLIEEGLPPGRVISLLTSYRDGRVVTPMRGMSAWLAAHSPQSRDLLIDADPVGIGLYGDISVLTAEQKAHLLRSLADAAHDGPLDGHEVWDQEAWGSVYPTAWAFRSIVSAETMPAIRELLSEAADDHASERIALFLLDVLAAAGRAMPTSSPTAASGDAAPETADVVDSSLTRQHESMVSQLESIVRDEGRSAYTRQAALAAYVSVVPADASRERRLRRLLDDIYSRRVVDPDNELAGRLLSELYPDTVTPAETWQYFLPSLRRNRYGKHQEIHYGNLECFWSNDLVDKSRAADSSVLLDGLCSRSESLLPALETTILDKVPKQLLASALEECGEQIEHERLYRWLSSVGTLSRRDPYRQNSSQTEEHEVIESSSEVETEHRTLADASAPIQTIRNWLERRPSVQKAVYLTWLRTRRRDGPLGRLAYWRCDALCGSRLPAEFWTWCVETAVSISESEPELAAELVRQAYPNARDDAADGNLTFDVLTTLVSEVVELNHLLKELRQPTECQIEAARMEQEFEQSERQQATEGHARQQEWIAHLSDNLSELENNRYNSANLGILGRMYLGYYPAADKTATGEERLVEHVGDNRQLIDAVLSALRDAIYRADVPDVKEAIALRSQSKIDRIAYAMLAGIELMEAEDPEQVDALTYDLRQRVVAQYLCAPTDDFETPPWYRRWLRQTPKAAAEVVTLVFVQSLRDGRGDLGGVDEMLQFVSDTEVVQPLLRRLLIAFPTRAPVRQLHILDQLLVRSLHALSVDSLRDIVRRKTHLKTMPANQRIRWLTADALSPNPVSLQDVADLVAARPARILAVAEFLSNASDFALPSGADRFTVNNVSERLSTEEFAAFISLLGCHYAPLNWSGSHTLRMKMAYILAKWIDQLAAKPDADASQALTELAEDAHMEAWHGHLRQAQEENSVIRRDADYRIVTMEDVQRTLRGDVPANAGDLAALIVDHLHDYSRRLQGDAENAWRDYWNEDRHGRPSDPKVENSCRDVLLRSLRSRLPSSAYAAPEAMHAGSTRADIGVRYGDFCVPIEIKPHKSTSLWTGLRRQLIEQYTTDPACDGYGIYVVLWFSPEELKQPPNGARVRTADELLQRLTADLTGDEARKISVVVLDVSKPSDAPQPNDGLPLGRLADAAA